MERPRFDDYIARFNREDATAFDDYLAPDMWMTNGALRYRGIDGMRDHYQNRIWPFFVERLSVLRFVSDADTLAVQMATNFTARADAETLFGPVRAGDQFDYRGLIMYEIVNTRFASITVAYNSFVRTDVSGAVHDLGMPH